MGIRLAHPVTDDENFELSILIGADYYWTLLEDHVIRGNMPIAIASNLGYLLSGPLPGTHSQTSTTSIFHVSVLSPTEVTKMEKF